MQSEDIEKFLLKRTAAEPNYVKICFRERDDFYGLFIQDSDYAYLKAKNFWRIVPQSQIDAYQKTKNPSLAKIYNGAAFSKLASYTESFE